MGQRGPIKKDAAKDRLAGNPGRRKRRAPAETNANASIEPIECPTWLPPAAAAEWQRVQPELKHPLRPGDIVPFAAYCQSVADLQWAAATLEREGRLITLDNGVYAPHPAVKLAAAAMTRIKQFASEFGLTPASRARVPDPPPPEEKDELGEFLAR